MLESLNELIEDHKDNLDVLDELSPESFKWLYESLLKNLIVIQE